MRAMPALLLPLSLLGCSDSTGPPAPGGPAPGAVTVTRASMGDRTGATGRPLADPLVVYVADQRERPLPDVRVDWMVTSGEAALDDKWSLCPPDSTGYAPVTAVTGTTGMEGLAAVSLVPLDFAVITIEARVDGLDPVTFTVDARDPGAQLVKVSGDGQTRTAAPLSVDGEHLVVEVRNGAGEPVDGVAVEWGVVQGDVRIFVQGCSGVTRTGSGSLTGVAATEFLPLAHGTSRVSGSVAGVSGSPQLFTATTALLQVVLDYDPWLYPEGTVFYGPRFTPHIAVPVGADIEFWNRLPSARIASISEPPGGDPFDSGELTEDDRFRFTPNVGGVWIFEDRVSGASGTIATVHRITLDFDPWFDRVVFGQAGSVPAGFAVEFLNREPSARIVSTAVPPGGVAFDSGPLEEDERFLFVPAAPGTWEFVDGVSGAVGQFVLRW